MKYYCWSRQDNSDDELKNLTIFANAGGHDFDNSEVNDIINRPFTGRFYVNETQITCHDNKEWSETIDYEYIYCPTSTVFVFVPVFVMWHLLYDGYNLNL